MADNKNIIEYTFKGSFEGADEVIREVDRINQRVSESMGTGTPNLAAAASAAGYGGGLPPTTDSGIMSGFTSGASSFGDSFGEFKQSLNDLSNELVEAMYSIRQELYKFDGISDQIRLGSGGAIQRSKDNDTAQELNNSVKDLRQSIQDDGKKKDGIGDLLGWMKAQALLQTTQHIGSSVANNAMQGNFISAGGGALGAIVGGGLGLLGGPAGMVTGLGMGASIGGGIGGMVERLLSGTGDAIKYETQIADINQRLGVGSVGRLRDYNQGGNLGFTAEQSAGLVDQLRENRALSNPAMAGPLVNVIQELTRALGLNVEATANMAGIYSRTGGEKGAEGVRGYLSDIVGGAIRAGFESNIQQYADMMGSARMQSAQQTGQAVSDRAFGVLQDVMAGLTGGDSRTSGLFRDNMQMAAGGLQTFMSFGGTTDPYSRQAALMRLAGIEEGALDSRFNSPEQIAANAQRGIGFITERLQGMTGMSEAQFNAAAANDPNFVQNIVRGNSTRQRQTSEYVSSFIGRQATGQDLRTFEELANIMAANGGQLPTGNNDGSRRVQQLMGQLQESPGDRARNLEAQAHNETIKAMSNFMEAANKLKEWQVDALKWINTLDLKAVGDGIADAMDRIRKWATEAGPHIKNAGAAMIEAAHKMRDAAKDFAEMIKAFRESAIGKMLFGGGFDPGAVGQQVGSTLSGPLGQNLGLTYMAAMPGPLGAIANAANIVRAVEANPEAVSVEGAQRAAGMIYRYGPYGPEARRRAPGFLRGAADYLGGMIDGIFNDTPGSVTASPGYNVFAFAPGDIISARMGGTSGGATLTDIHQVLTQSNVMAVQFEQNQSGRSKVLQDSTNNILATDLLIQTNSDLNTTKQFPALIDLNQFLAKAATVRDGLLAKIEAHFPVLIGAVMSVGEAIANLSSITGGNAGGLGSAFASGLFTGPRANIGGSSPNHIDTKFRTSVSWEDIDKYFMQMAQAYAEQGRRIEFSNNAVAGQVFDPSMPQEDRIKLLQRAAAAHAPRSGWHSFDYYIPKTGDARSEDPNSSSAGAEIMLPVIPGGRVDYATDPATVGGYGNFATLYDAAGNRIMTTGHGDNRRALPQGRTFPSQPIASGGQSGTYRPNVSQEFLNATDAMAQRLGIRPEYLLAAMGFETGGTFDPAERNRRSGATGLIQFIPDTARGLGTSTSALAGMSQMQQLQYVERYLRQYSSNGRLDSLEDVYMSILYPAAIGRGPNHTLFAQGSTAYRQNQGLDINRDGRITVGEATERVRSYLPSRETLERLPSYQSRASAGDGNRTNNITINIANATHPQETAQAIVAAARPYLDEHETNRQVNRNPRNNQSLSPVYG